MSKKKKRAKNHLNNEVTKGIFTVLEAEPQKSFNYKQIAAQLQITSTDQRNLLIKRLGQLAEKNRIAQPARGKYKAIYVPTSFTGTLDVNSQGNGYVVTEELEEDIFVSYPNLNRAFHGDTVEVQLFQKRKQSRPEGKILKVVKRKKTAFVGIVDTYKSFAFVRPTDHRMYTDIFVRLDDLQGAKEHEKVLVEMLDWPEDADSPFGKVIEVLGIPGEHDTEIHSILAEYGLPYRFPPEVEAEANALDTRIDEAEVARRKDFRDVLTFTIDPKDAKDFDDALSFRPLENGDVEVGIHIADVSHYLQADTLLEEEAYERATSVYLVDRVVPMLPEILSNNACSLRPHEDKYTFSAVFVLDANAQVKKRWFGRTAIHSDERFAYEEAQHVIETGKGEIPETVSIREEGAYQVKGALVDAITTLDQLAKIMRRRRMDYGAISFDKVEVKFHLDENNQPVGVYVKESKDANKLIEEFMLLANREVAAFIGKQQPVKTFIYRVHDRPDEDKLMVLNGIVKRFGHSLDFKNPKSLNSSLNQLLEDVKGKKEQNLVDTLAIRSMSKAEYSTQNIGHYGLAFNYYTHFTSPIRRYPDVMVHRLLDHYLKGGKTPAEKTYEEKAKHSTSMEILAANAERDSVKYMQVKFMEDHRDQEFDGVISGVTEWGIYVEIVENKCEGMVRIRDLKDDYYTFDERQYALVGERKGSVYQLGDEVRVMVKHTDLIKRHLDFALIGKR
ncbi:ribonuclease R [Robiginitalea sp. M366]|uniref:ribonuclease R n=1 Tax=Robiginitalea aestuariiviva TaxID=3036903 RepID=UPI00240DDB04|nr:ribonuclease R [Robiginitalea aestuariiviva]MDG1571514.1 ribonuclease R [Robiginitalea aestuariiviva]